MIWDQRYATEEYVYLLRNKLLVSNLFLKRVVYGTAPNAIVVDAVAGLQTRRRGSFARNRRMEA